MSEAEAWRNLHRPAPVPAGAHLTFFETSDAVERFLATSAAHETDVCVALDPMAAWALKRAGVSYVTLDHGYREDDVRALTEPVLERQEAWASMVDAKLATLVPAFASGDFRPARLYLHWFKLAFDSLTITAWTVDRAVHTWQPGSVRYVGAPPAPETFGPDLAVVHSLYRSILPMVAASRAIAFRVETVAGPSPPGVPPLHAGISRWWRHTYLKAKHRAKRTLSEVGMSATAPGGLAIGDGYDLTPVRRLAQRRGIRVASWAATVRRFEATARRVHTTEVDLHLRRAWDILSNEPAFRTPLRETDIDLFPLVASRLEYWLTTIVPHLWRVYDIVRRSPAEHRPAVAVVPHLANPAEVAVFSAFRADGVRTVVYQHGGLIGVCDCASFDVGDQAAPEWLLTYGEGMSEYFAERRRLRGRELAVPVSVGSARCDQLRQSVRRSHRHTTTRRRVVIVPGVIVGNDRRIDKGNLPDVVEADVQTALVAAARRFPQHEFVFKTFPVAVRAPTPAALIAAEPDANCRLDSRTNLPLLMTDASLIVLTMPATALLEAIQTDASILVLIDQRSIDIRPAALAALKRRAHVEVTPDAFIARYHQLLTEGTFGADTHADRTFSRMYATHEDDGRSAERVLERLLPGRGDGQ
jgi:hypothetical protein